MQCFPRFNFGTSNVLFVYVIRFSASIFLRKTEAVFTGPEKDASLAKIFLVNLATNPKTVYALNPNLRKVISWVGNYTLLQTYCKLLSWSKNVHGLSIGWLP